MSLKEELVEYSTTELEREVARRKEPIVLPEPLENLDFINVISQVKEYIAKVGDESQYLDDDDEHYIFEAAIEAVFGNKIWKWHNERL